MCLCGGLPAASLARSKANHQLPPTHPTHTRHPRHTPPGVEVLSQRLRVLCVKQVAVAHHEHERQRGGVLGAQRLEVLHALPDAARLGQVAARAGGRVWWVVVGLMDSVCVCVRAPVWVVRGLEAAQVRMRRRLAQNLWQTRPASHGSTPSEPCVKHHPRPPSLRAFEHAPARPYRAYAFHTTGECGQRAHTLRRCCSAAVKSRSAKAASNCTRRRTSRFQRSLQLQQISGGACESVDGRLRAVLLIRWRLHVLKAGKRSKPMRQPAKSITLPPQPARQAAGSRQPCKRA